ncbi:helix-turn-helix domain-containing protein [Akkermansiaceae bacterium]|jgi:excisionase family DNA binding protein|nr:helix-turn-helix domain-containing protein [Akkermansiaceae bacterium]|tara:strand:- start:1335 stop:1583 length:249 start_codon:yes stop_codon:yes gene_type:complete
MSEIESYVPVEEVADYLSVKVSTIRQWVNKGFIPKSTYIKVGYTYRFNIPAVIEALKQEELSPDPTQITEQLELNFNEEDDL